jgi:hypothetical protein
MRNYTLSIDLKAINMRKNGIIRTKIPTTGLSSKVPDQEPPNCKSMDQNHVSVTHRSSSYLCSKVHPYESLKVK